jgi:lipocalin-like protein
MGRRVRSLMRVFIVFVAARSVAALEPGVVGAWRFEKEVDTRADGTRISVGPKDGYNGFLMYAADGRMMVQIMPRGRSWKRSAVTPEELRETVEAGDAYYGRYSIEPAAGTVTHHVEGSLDPSEEGTPLVRRYRLDGDKLVLSGSWEYAGEKLNFEITWSRVK